MDDSHLRKALREADWEAMLPSLLAYAARRLRRMGWASGNGQEPSRMSVEQLVNAAVEHCLDGTRVWDPKAVDLGGFLRGVIRSLASSERKKEVRAKTYATDDMSKHFEPLASAEDDVVGEENRSVILSMVEQCVADDADLKALYLAILEGHTKRDELAAVLNWKADRVTAARIKLQRRLVRAAPERFAAVRERQRRSP